jgi:hypothetical protein
MLPLPLLTHSRSRCARSCLREELLRYVQGYRPVVVAEPLRFGSLCHMGLEVRWKNLGSPDRLALMLQAVAGEADPFMRARSEAMLLGYDVRWKDDADLYEVIAVEQEFRTPLVNPDTGARSQTFDLGGKIDGIIRERASGDKLNIEHKTTSENIDVGSTYWSRLRMDSQIGVYTEGARSLGHEVRGTLWDVLVTPYLRPLKATPPESRKFTKDGRLYANQREFDETPEEYRARVVARIAEDPAEFYARSEIGRLEKELTDGARDRWQLAQQLRDGHRLGRAPRNPDACLRYSRPCDFFDVCSSAADIDDPTKFTHSENVHPELTP